SRLPSCPPLTRPVSTFLMLRPPPTSTLFPYTTLFRSSTVKCQPSTSPSLSGLGVSNPLGLLCRSRALTSWARRVGGFRVNLANRSEEHTSELQSRENLVCRLLLEKKKQGDMKQHGAEW